MQAEILSQGKTKAVLGGGFKSSQGDRRCLLIAAKYLQSGLN